MSSSNLDLIKIMWESGFVVKGVLLLLVAASVYSWAIIFFKMRSFKLLEKQNRIFWNHYLAASDLEDAFERTADLPLSPYKITFNMGYAEWAKIQESGIHPRQVLQEFGTQIIERSMHRARNHSNQQMEKSLATLASVGSISPFVGLFGTVWGIIDSFAALSSGGERWKRWRRESPRP